MPEGRPHDGEERAGSPHARKTVPPDDNCCWVRAATSSAAVLQRSRRPPTWALVPRRGSSVGTRWSESRPGTSKITESQDAAATESAYCRRQRPRK